MAERPLEQKQKLSLVDVLDPTYREILLSGLVVLWFAFGIGTDSKIANVISTVGLTAFSAILAWAAYRNVQRDVSALWTPLFWYRVAMLSYFGIGSLVPIWTNDDTLKLMEGFYEFFPSEIVRFNLLIVVSHITFLLTTKIIFIVVKNQASVNRKSATDSGLIRKSNFSMMAFGTICLTIGTLVNYLIILPQVLGILNLQALGTINNLAALAWIGYFLVGLWALNNNRKSAIVAVMLIAGGESLLGMFLMSKSVILVPVLMVGLAYIYHRNSFKRMLIFSALLMSIFMFLSPIITYVRQINQGDYNGSAKPAEALSIYLSYFSNDRALDPYSEVEVGWMRLSYVNVGTFAMDQYDRGMPGNTYRYLPIVLIPRIIYKDKPFITDLGREFSYMANGNYDSSTSPGLMAEAYWNYGWTGVLGMAITISIIFTFWSIYSFAVIDRSAWHLFFVVLLGLRTAIRVDGMFVADIFSGLGLAMLAHVILELLNRFLPHRLVEIFGEKT